MRDHTAGHISTSIGKSPVELERFQQHGEAETAFRVAAALGIEASGSRRADKSVLDHFLHCKLHGALCQSRIRDCVVRTNIL
jgi:hypothetical protein